MSVILTLDSSVDNDGLYKLNEFKLQVNATSKQTIYFDYNHTLEARIIGDGHFRSSESADDDVGTEISFTGAMNISSGAYDIYVKSKFDFTTLNITKPSVTVDLEEFYFRTTRFNLTVNGGIVENLDEKSMPILSSIELANCGLVFPIDFLASMVSPSNIKVQGNVGITGDISTLGSFITLKNLNVYGTSVVNDWETLCDTMVENGRTSGTLIVTMTSATKTITFDSSVERGWTVA